MTKPKMLFFDLETTPNLGFAYGVWGTRLIKIEQYSGIMSISYSWNGGKIEHVNPTNLVRKNDETVSAAMARFIWNLFDEADVVVAHNAYKFDVKVVNSEFIRNGLTPPSPYKIVDTLRMARKIGKFPGGNGLNALAAYLGLGLKAEITFADLWYRCLQNDPKAWKLLKKYNDQDVRLLIDVYERLKAWDTSHPNMGDLMQADGVCPTCGSSQVFQYGSAPRRNGRVRAFRCHDCGRRCNENTVKKIGGRLVNA